MARTAAEREAWRKIRAAHPGLREAIVADALTTMRFRGEGADFDSRLDALRQIVRLAWRSDAFLGQIIYRVKTRMLALGIPVLPRLAHGLAMSIAQISIGDEVVIESGVCIAHGQVVIGGLTRIGTGALITPFVSIGLLAGNFKGPTLERGVRVGTGARILGPLRIGEGAEIGANAVVTRDVEPGATVVGVPARPV